MRRMKLLAGIVLSSCLLALGFGFSANAADFSSIKVKAAYEGVYNCFNIDGQAALTSAFSASDGAAGMLLKKGSGTAVKLPFGLTDAKDNNANCKEVLFGFSSNINGDELNKGLLPTSIQDSSDKTTIKNYYAGNSGNGGSGTMGYKAEQSGNVTSGQTTQQLKISFDNDYSSQCYGSDGQLASSKFMDEDTEKEYSELIFPTVTKDSSGNWWIGDNSANNSGINVPEPGSGGSKFFTFCGDSGFSVIDQGSALSPYYTIYGFFTYYYQDPMYNTMTPSSMEINDIISAADGTYNKHKCNTSIGYALQSTCTEGVVEDSAEYDDWQFTWTAMDYMVPISKISSTTNSGYKLSKSSKYADLALSDQEVYNLYRYYIEDVFKVPVACEGNANYDAYSSRPTINWTPGVSCKADTSSPAIVQYPGNVYGVANTGTDSNPEWHFTAEVSLDDIISTLSKIDLEKLEETADSGTVTDPENGGNSGGAIDPETGEPVATEDDYCYNSGVVGMSWILCPAIENTSNTVGVIDGLLKSWMSTPTTWYGDGSSTQTAWNMFRKIANIAIIIILVAIILSQITGYGIDNYGIKRMLPRLLVMAILINLSFIICQLAIDASNILGSGLSNMFEALGNEIMSKHGHSWGEESFATLITSILAIAAGAGAAGGFIVSVVGAATTGGGVMIIIVLVLALLVALVAVLMFFVMLGARMIIVIIFTAIAPLAFACYILPNTQNLFKKWWDVFKTALVMYPICGALYGLSFVIRGIIFSDGNGVHIWMAMVAVCAPFLPFLILPQLLKGALAMLGKTGLALGTLGAGLKGGLNRGSQAIQNSDRYKMEKDQQYRNKMRKFAGLGENGIGLSESGQKRWNRRGMKNGKITAYGRRMAAAAEAVRKSDAGDVAGMASMMQAQAQTEAGTAPEYAYDGGSFKEGTLEALYAKRIEDAISAGDINGMNAAITAAKDSGVEAKNIAKMLRAVTNKGAFNTGFKDKNIRAAAMRSLAQTHGGLLTKDFELAHYMQNGGESGIKVGNEENVLGKYGQYAAANIKADDIKPDDLAGLSGDSIAALASANKIDTSMAKQMVARGGLSPDKAVMFGALGAGAKVSDADQAAFTAWAKEMANLAPDPATGQKAYRDWEAGDGSRVALNQNTFDDWVNPAQEFKIRGGGTP